MCRSGRGRGRQQVAATDPDAGLAGHAHARPAVPRHRDARPQAGRSGRADRNGDLQRVHERDVHGRTHVHVDQPGGRGRDRRDVGLVHAHGGRVVLRGRHVLGRRQLRDDHVGVQRADRGGRGDESAATTTTTTAAAAPATTAAPATAAAPAGTAMHASARTGTARWDDLRDSAPGGMHAAPRPGTSRRQAVRARDRCDSREDGLRRNAVPGDDPRPPDRAGRLHARRQDRPRAHRAERRHPLGDAGQPADAAGGHPPGGRTRDLHEAERDQISLPSRDVQSLRPQGRVAGVHWIGTGISGRRLLARAGGGPGSSCDLARASSPREVVNRLAEESSAAGSHAVQPVAKDYLQIVGVMA